VTPTQLEARGGKVRCGRCLNVFDAFQALTAGNVTAPSENAAAEHVPSPHARREGSGAGPPASRAAKGGGAGRSTLVPADLRARLEPLLARVRASQLSLRHQGPVTQWSIAAAIAALILLLQLGYAWRSELAARSSAFRSIYSGICALTGCHIPFPRTIDLVKIEASDVHMLDANRPQFIQLTATLRSYAGYYVAYPALDLVLTNATEHALARRVFVPQEYLARDRDPNAGFPPNAEITIALDLDTGNLNAAGFRLGLLASP
jgi:hypothetical protein